MKRDKIYIDHASSAWEATRQLNYWAAVIRGLGAEEIAGVSVEKYAKGKWGIRLHAYVSRDSQAFKDFMRRFR